MADWDKELRRAFQFGSLEKTVYCHPELEAPIVEVLTRVGLADRATVEPRSSCKPGTAFVVDPGSIRTEHLG